MARAIASEVRKLSDPARRIAALPALRQSAPASAVTFGRLSKMIPTTPSGVATHHHGEAWGVALLHELMGLVARAARSVKPDALLIGHTPNPWFGGLVDMIRLNDMLRLDDPEPRVDIVPQMRYRAAVVRAALPGHLIDTDDWCPPDLAAWRRYLAMKAELGVPALYYATGLDLSGEDFEAEDYAAIRHVWADYRAANGLPTRGGAPT